MRVMGAGDADIARIREQWEATEAVRQQCLVEVYPENIPYLRALLLLQDQWEFPDGFGGGRLAIPLGEREIAMRSFGIEINGVNHGRMGVMLGAARAVLVERRRQEIESTR